MSLRSCSSNALASVLLNRHRRRLTLGCPFSLPLRCWQHLPQGVHRWLWYRLFEPSEDFAWTEVERHDVLGGFCDRRGASSWAISPAAMLALWRTLSDNSPRRIIEFGSGMTTWIFATYAAIMAERGNPISFLSLEHEHKWLEATKTRLNAMGLDAHVHLLHAPLSEQHLLGRRMLAYDIDADLLSRAAGDDGFDCCLIDGPPGNVGRAGCLPLIADRLNHNAMVILDDAFRPGEQAVLSEWRSHYFRQMRRNRILLVDSHGMATFQWRKRGVPLGR